MTPGTWYSRLTPARRAEVIARNSKRGEERRAALRKIGLCVCGNQLRKVREWLYASKCEECRNVQKMKESAR